MKKTLVSAAAYLIANGAGLLLAALLIDGVTVGFTAFIVAVLIFCVVQAIALPLVSKISKKYAPQLLGGISLVAIFCGLLITGLIVSGLTIGGLANLLSATLLVWLGSLIAQFGLKMAGFGSAHTASVKCTPAPWIRSASTVFNSPIGPRRSFESFAKVTWTRFM